MNRDQYTIGGTIKHQLLTDTIFPLILITVTGICFFLYLLFTESIDKILSDLRLVEVLVQEELNHFAITTKSLAEQRSLQILLELKVHEKLGLELNSLAKKHLFDGAIVLDSSNKILARSMNPAFHGDKLTELKLIQSALKGETTQTLDLTSLTQLQNEGYTIPFPAEKLLTLAVAAPVYNRQGQVIGVLMMRKFIMTHQALMNKITRSVNLKTAIYQNQTLAIANFQADDMQQSSFAALEDENINELFNKRQKVKRISLNTSTISIFSPILNANEEAIGVILLMDKSRSLSLLILGSSLVIFFILGIGLMAFYHLRGALQLKIFNPLQILQQNIADFKHGKSFQIDSSNQPLELQQLTDSFKELTEQLEEKENVIQGSKKEFEMKVKDRTQGIEIEQSCLRQIHEITREVMGNMDMQNSAQVFIERTIACIRPSGAGSVMLFDEEKMELQFFVSFGLNLSIQEKMKLKVSADSLYSFSVLTEIKARLFTSDDLHIFQQKNFRELHFGKRIFQQMVSPLVSGEKSIGLVSISNYEMDRPFTQSEINMMENLTDSLSAHFQNASLYKASHIHEREIERLNIILNVMNKNLIREAIIPEVMQHFKNWFPFDHIGIQMFNFQENRIEFGHELYGLGHSLAPKHSNYSFALRMDNDSIFEKVMHSHQHQYIQDLHENVELSASHNVYLHNYFHNAKTLLLFPLETQEIVIGTLSFAACQVSPILDQELLKSMQHIISQFASGLRTAILYERILADKTALEKTYEDLKSTKIQLSETEKIVNLTNVFEKFVPRQFLSNLNQQGWEFIQAGYSKRKVLSIVFSDIRAFTNLSETMSVEENFNFINDYLNRMEPCITNNQGFIDKFIGDAIMALFDGGDSANQAIRSAIDMQNSLRYFNQWRLNQGLAAIQVGIGINTGEIMMGVVGNAQRMNSTVIGDNVNLASRLESLTKLYYAKILISGKTHSQINHLDYHIREIDTLKVSGKDQPLTVYEIYDADEAEIINLKDSSKDLLMQGMVLFKLQHFKEAIGFFEQCLKIYPKDIVPVEYIKRCYYLNKYPPNNKYWDGVMQDTDYSFHSLLNRRSPRFNYNLPINLYMRERKQNFAARGIDISKSGLKVESNLHLEVLETLMLEIYFRKSTLDDFLTQKPMVVMGQVAWRKAPDFSTEFWVFGIEFVLLTDDDEFLLKHEMLDLQTNQTSFN